MTSGTGTQASAKLSGSVISGSNGTVTAAITVVLHYTTTGPLA